MNSGSSNPQTAHYGEDLGHGTGPPKSQPVANISHHMYYLVLLLVFSVLACIAVVLRFVGRRIQKQRFALNDFLIVPGLVFALAESGVFLYNVLTMMKNQPRGPPLPEDREQSMLVSFLSIIFWAVAVTSIRASIIFLYIHLFPTSPFRAVCYGVLAMNVAFLASTVLGESLISRQYIFQRVHPTESSFGGRKRLGQFIPILNLIQDIIVVALPMPILWRLQMATKRKVALSCVFGLGIAICAVTACRVKLSLSSGDQSTPQSHKTFLDIGFMACLESLLGIINACLPMMRPVFKKLMPQHRGRSGNTTTSGRIPIVMRVSQMLSLSSRQHRSRGYAATASSLQSQEQAKISHVGRHSPVPKAESVLGIKVAEVQARRDVDVEAASRTSSI